MKFVHNIWDALILFCGRNGYTNMLANLVLNTSQIRLWVMAAGAGLASKGLIEKGWLSSEMLIGISVNIVVALLTNLVTYMKTEYAELSKSKVVIAVAQEVKIEAKAEAETIKAETKSTNLEDLKAKAEDLKKKAEEMRNKNK